jgi:hypothetical protein
VSLLARKGRRVRAAPVVFRESDPVGSAGVPVDAQSVLYAAYEMVDGYQRRGRDASCVHNIYTAKRGFT